LVSGLAEGDIAADELVALSELLSRFERGEVSLVCSEAVGDELAKIPANYRGPHIQQLKVFGTIPRAKPGGVTRLTAMGVPGVSPYRSLWDALVALLPDKPDAEHVFVAWINRINRLVTLDERTMLRHRAAVRALSGVELMTPREFLHAASLGS
jgi:hypothetical protein